MPDEALLLKEWDVVRELLEDGNKRVHAIRRVGFSLVSTLMTASSLFLHKSGTDGAGEVAAGIAGVAVVLLVAMHLAEREARLFQAAVASRGSAIERHLGLELGDTITYRYEEERWPVIVKMVYSLFVVATCGVAWAVAIGNGCPAPLAIMGIGAAGLACIAGYSPGKLRGLEYADWSVVRLASGRRRFARIMFTILQRKRGDWPFKEEEKIWEVHRRDPVDAATSGMHPTSQVVATYFANAEDAASQRCRTWLLETTTWEPGLYDFFVFQGRDKKKEPVLRAMNRRLTVLPESVRGAADPEHDGGSP